MTKSKIFIGISISFGGGVLLGSLINIRQDYLFLGIGLSIVAFVFSFIKRHKPTALAALFLFCFGLGLLRIYSSMAPNQFESWFDTKQQFEGYVVQEADVRQNEQLLTVRPKGFDQNVLVFANFEQKYFYGDEVVINGKVEAPQNFSDFDYVGYLERFNIYAMVKYPKILILRSHQLNPIKDGLLQIKAAFVRRINAFLPEPQSSLLLGILIGARKSLPQSVVDNFNATGTSHIIAISGFNITIIVSALAFLNRLIGRKTSFWLTLIVICCFIIITGGNATVIRAGIMGSMFLLSGRIGRQYHIGAGLFCSALIMLLLNPKILYWDIGFQLSFAATLGIIYFMPILEQLTENWPNLASTKSILFTTLVAIVATLPLMLLHFGNLSIVAPIVNILILTEILPATMLLGFLIVIPYLAPGFAFVANIFLLYILTVIDFFAHLPFSHLQITISGWTFAGLVVADLGLYMGLSYLSQRKSSVVPVGEDLILPSESGG